MGRLSTPTRRELVAAASRRYSDANREERGRILDELTSLTGLHRKHAARLLRGGGGRTRHEPRPQRRLYDDAVREALVVLWETSDRVCGKRLRPLVPILLEAMERHGHLQLDSDVRNGLLSMSAATIDRALRVVRGRSGERRRRRSPLSAADRRSVVVRTFEGWDGPPPGFVDADLVAHSGPVAKGSFVQTLTMTDIATGWTECAPILVREQSQLTAVLGEVRKMLPFPLLGFDTDNDSVFLNETMPFSCNAPYTSPAPLTATFAPFITIESQAARVAALSKPDWPFKTLAAANAAPSTSRDMRAFSRYALPKSMAKPTNVPSRAKLIVTKTRIDPFWFNFLIDSPMR